MTNQSSASSILKLLADDTRWQLITALRRSDRQAGELGTLLKLPQNLVSYHLGVLRQAGLVQAHRSDADARAVYYSLDVAALGSGYARIGDAFNYLRRGVNAVNTRFRDPKVLSEQATCDCHSAFFV